MANFHKIHCGTISIDGDKYLTPFDRPELTRLSHNSYSIAGLMHRDALKYYLLPIGKVYLRLINVAAETTERSSCADSNAS